MSSLTNLCPILLNKACGDTQVFHKEESQRDVYWISFCQVRRYVGRYVSAKNSDSLDKLAIKRHLCNKLRGVLVSLESQENMNFDC